MREIEISREFLNKNAIWIRNDDTYFIEIKSACKELQNETNPSSVAPLVWKWCCTEGERVRKSLHKHWVWLIYSFKPQEIKRVALRIGNIKTQLSRNRIPWAFWCNFQIQNRSYKIASFSLVQIGVKNL